MDVIERYLAEVSALAPDVDAVAKLLHEDVEFIEHPNLISPKGRVRDRQGMLDGVQAGAEIIARQHFDVWDRIRVDADSHVLRAAWEGELAVRIGAWRMGTVLRAKLAMFFELRDDLIVRQENFDCYEPPQPT
ncbi:MAG: nuclear transport factor 2 family protein [Myxococcales bacterium]|nr:nuclear transport factor 2 family protein [Myxococcales bacterium]